MKNLEARRESPRPYLFQVCETGPEFFFFVRLERDDRPGWRDSSQQREQMWKIDATPAQGQVFVLFAEVVVEVELPEVGSEGRNPCIHGDAAENSLVSQI